MSALTETYLQGVSTRKELGGELSRFTRRRLEAEYPYLIVDARYVKGREDGVVRSRAVQVAIGIDWEGRRQVLGVGMKSTRHTQLA